MANAAQRVSITALARLHTLLPLSFSLGLGLSIGLSRPPLLSVFLLPLLDFPRLLRAQRAICIAVLPHPPIAIPRILPLEPARVLDAAAHRVPALAGAHEVPRACGVDLAAD
ncbi:hypothetical protein C7974DRAFT_398360 [Boeremia exigua]|uniref:uncharacterized protein n=1 Tax=Boeremia exigua TaxID=749465 RepID=UPI001E8D3947|nr:uncharacterized protein C7974DRAFT_398360 [Boeremia exigua]KAH6622474.1 hypothetical protein C7974DRAFT_398360 [Boeremia exigua]